MTISRRTMVAGMITATAPLVGGMRRAFAQETINLTIASSHPTALAWVGPLKTIVVEKSNPMLEEMGSPYRINWTEAFGGALYNFNDTLEAVSQQLTDIGWVGALWEPAALPLQNIMYSTPFTTKTATQAITIMNDLNDSEQAMKDEWAAQNVRFFGSCVADGYHLFTKKPIKTLDDVAGLKILGAPTVAPWLEPLGATVVVTGLPQQYSQLQTGVGDGSMLIATGAWPLKIYEVAPYMTVIDTGPLTFGGFGINADTYDALPEDVQKVIAALGREYSDENARQIEEKTELAFKAMGDEGTDIAIMPEDQKLDWVNRMPDLGKLWVESLEAKGVEARPIMKNYMAKAREIGGDPLRDWAANL
jgi:TRAP-type C4-dicarboxylate transport system substrate-binding protein